VTDQEQANASLRRKQKLSEDHIKFLNRIKILRDEKGWSQKNTAIYLNMKPTSFSDLEQGAKRVDLDKLIKMAKLFDVTVGFLVAGEREGLTDQQKERVNRRFNL